MDAKMARLRRKVSEEGLKGLTTWILRRIYQEVTSSRFRWLRLKQDRLFPLRNRLLSNRPVRVEVGDISVLMVPKGGVIANIWSGLRLEELREAQFISQLLQPRMTFFDIGANTGLFAIAAAKKDPSIQVFAFEPSTWTFQVLKENIRLNDVDNVRAYAVALGDWIGEATLQVNAPGADGLNTIGRPSHPGCRVVAQEKVPITTLDTFLWEHGIRKVDVMKVDVEGAELLVFRGARKLLERTDAPLILYEGFSWCTKGFHYHPVEIMWLLQNHGYSLFVLNGETGQIAHRKPGHGYDAMIVAIKRGHPFWGKLQRDA